MNQMQSTASNYRPEIDGLRALAVIPVILFHAGLEVVSGGFIGVDVFFVISGYLITLILLGDLEKGRLSLGSFYERRIRRILPALLCVTLAFSPLALSLLSPDELRDFGKGLASLAVFGSNIFFWKNIEYFAPDAEMQPLLHTWSLAVEEQFYIVFPLLLMLLMQLGRTAAFTALLALMLASLLLSQWAVAHYPAATYFLLPTRAWELLLGVLLAFVQIARPVASPGFASSLLAAAGLVLVAASVLLFDKHVPHPSLYTLAPTLGAVLIIRYASPANLAGRLLCMKPVVGMGLISYSAYLIHQPLFAMARLVSGHEPPPLTMAGLVLLVISLSYFSWRFIENPCRAVALPRRQVLRAAAFGLGLVATTGIALSVVEPQGVLYDMPGSVRASFNHPDLDCYNEVGAHAKADWICPINADGKERIDFAFVGDSHMESLVPAIRRWAEAKGYSGVYVGLPACPPLIGVYALGKNNSRFNCFELNARVLDFVRDKGISNVVLASRWTFYTEGGYQGADRQYLALSPDGKRDLNASNQAFAAGLRKTLEAYRDLQVKVHVILQVPQQAKNPYGVYYNARGLRQEPMRRVLRDESVSLESHRALQARTNRMFEDLKAVHPAMLSLFDPTASFCSAGTCLLGEESASYYRDDDHLSASGAMRLIPQLERELDLVTGAQSQLAGRGR